MSAILVLVALSGACRPTETDAPGDSDALCDQPTPWFPDADGDTHGDADSEPVSACTAPVDHVADDTDCDDTRDDVFPGAAEACDGLDNDCDDLRDEGVTTDFWLDGDGDGFGDEAGQPVAACEPPSSAHVTHGGDCDDRRSAVYPGAPRACDGGDTDCDGHDEDLAIPGAYADVAAAIAVAIDGDRLCFGVGEFVTSPYLQGKSVTLEGAGRDQTTLVAFPGSRVLDVSNSPAVAVRDLTIRGGRTSGYGAGIRASGTGVLQLERVNLDDNHIYTSGIADEEGAGLYMWGGELILDQVRFTGNRIETRGTGLVQGAGLYVLGTATRMSDIVFEENVLSAPDGLAWGGAFSQQDGVTTAMDVTFADNAITAAWDVMGAALAVRQGAGTFVRTTITGNHTTATGGDAAGAVAVVQSSTAVFRNGLITGSGVVGAQDAYAGAALVRRSDVTFENCTLADHVLEGSRWVDGADIKAEDQAVLTLRNTIVSGTTATGDARVLGHVHRVTSAVSVTFSAFDPDDFHGMISPVGMQGNVATVPGFLPGGHVLDPATSVLVDAGDPTILDRDGTRSDMGHLGGPDAW